LLKKFYYVADGFYEDPKTTKFRVIFFLGIPLPSPLLTDS
jgi:hypothetical protein